MITDKRRTELYPQLDEVGEEFDIDLPLSHGVLPFQGVFLGVASARQDKHNHGGPHPPYGRRCPACRWYEPRIFRETGGTRRYVLYTLGCSDLPGETDQPRYRYADDAYEAIFIMSTPSTDGDSRFLTAPARRMFQMAAGNDEEIKEALSRQWVTHEAPVERGRWNDR